MLVRLTTLLAAGPKRLSGAKLCRMVSTKCSTSTSTSKREVLILHKAYRSGVKPPKLPMGSSTKAVL